MAIAAVIVKLMPESPESNLEEIQEKAKAVLESLDAQNITFDQEPIAFGLKAILVKFAWPEEKDTSLFENALGELEHISSAQTSDYRRAFG